MAIPKWITPAGQLGIVPELEYYEFPLDAYDTSGGLLVFSRVSGRLPLGLQVISPTEYTITTNGNITAYTGSYISQYSSGANAVVVLDDTVSGTSVTVRYVNEIEFDIFGNLTVDGANVSVKPTNIANPSPARIQGIPVSETSGEQNVTYNFTVRAQNAWTGNLADRTFNLTITNVVPPIITPKTFVNKNKVTLSENLSANIGDYITQSISGANAVLLTSAVNTNIITVTYVSGSPTFTFGLGNLSVKNGNVSTGTTAYPVSSTIISSTTPQNLGIYLDGSDVSLQLETVAPLPGEVLTWTLKSGDLPPGLTLSTDGLLVGVLDPIPSIAPGTTPNWDNTSWNNVGWDFPETAIAKRFTFTIQVYDGVNYDQNTYSLEVYPRSGLTADNDELLVSVTTLGTGVPLTIDYGNKHNPIITTTQDDLVPVREGSYFAFEFEARDIDGDVVYFTVPALVTGSFDEQAFSNVAQSYPYITEYPINNRLYTGVFPSQLVTTFAEANISASSTDITAGEHLPGDTIKILTADNYWQMATVTSDVTVRITGNNIVTASAGQYLTQASSLANALISNVSTTTGTINLSGDIITGVINTLYPTYDITFSGNITANIGQYITQASSGANARVLDTFRYITLTGANAATITANIGDYITQNGSTGNAMVVEQSINSPTIYIDYISGSFSNVGDIKLNGANVVNAVPETIISTSNVISVIMVSNMFTNGSGNIQVNGSSTGIYPVSRLKDIQNITLTANVGDIITQVGHSGNATVTANITDAVSIPVRYNSGTFNNFGGNLKINGVDANVWITANTQGSNAFAITTTVGQYITQASSGANAVVIANVVNGSIIPVQFLSNAFVVGSGNLAINASNVTAYPGRVVANTDISATYIGANTFDFNSTLATAVPLINGVSLYGNISTLISVGVSLGALSTEGTVGFDEAKFDQGALSLPQGLSLNPYSGWITGQLPSQTINQIDYEFEILAYKRDDPTYQDSQLYTLTVLGDLNNRIDWITATDLGVITTGKVSDLFVYATSALGKTLFYELAADSYQRLPQGLSLTLNGLISGRVSFELFSLDSSLTTIDGSTTTFDNNYRFTVTARDINNTIAANRTFTLRVRQFDLIPYENIYLKALPTRAQRTTFEELMNDRSIFPLDKIYRVEDPWFGLAKDIRSLFLAGLSPSTLAEYAQAVSTNHFTKRFLFAGVKTAQVLDENFNVKYEVVYLQLDSENDIEAATFANVDEVGPPNTIDLSDNITTPYYDADGNAYTTAYPNSTQNMESKLISQIGYENKGALPDWMTSRQANGRQLGFNHAVVLAYTKPGESALIAYRLNERNFDFNSIDFTVDRYELDNIYTANFDVTANAFITSSETTFDRYPPLAGSLNYVATVNYALSTPYDQIHLHTVDEIKALGGLDGVKNFKDGDTIVFGLQEFRINQNTAPDYNDGWSDVLEQWDRDPWAQNTDITDSDVLTPYDPTLVPPNLPPYDFSPGEKWDAAQYIPGFNENLLDPNVPNKRIGVWRVNISSENIVTLSYIQAVEYYDAIFVRNGFTYGGTNIYYDPVVKSGYNVANYSIIPQTIRTTYTTFDGNGTRFFDHRDIYNVPEQGDKYIKFTKTGVFT